MSKYGCMNCPATFNESLIYRTLRTVGDGDLYSDRHAYS
jgi:hypothetical protein